MKDDVRYSEFLFLCYLEKNPLKYISPNNQEQQGAFGLNQVMFAEMLVTLLEDLYVQLNHDDLQLLVWQLRGEASPREVTKTSNIAPYPAFMRQRNSPRVELYNRFIGAEYYQFRITYRGLRRIEELRDLLKRDRILDDFGVLLSNRYFQRDLQEALQRDMSIQISVFYIDMDNFKKINTKFGHEAGNVIMKDYLEVVRDSLGLFGVGYRGVGDEVEVLIIGQRHQRANELAEKIRQSMETRHCQYKEIQLPSVTVSIGLATTPPAPRNLDLETLAEDCNRQAKDKGRNCIVTL